ncbi:MAG: DNA recombination protein RmuC [Lachnospiraceae bacterium]|nr:DNA recombination protein RmuC [Lachnospiraceae bacterium]
MVAWQFVLIIAMLAAVIILAALVLVRQGEMRSDGKKQEDFEDLQDELVRLAEQVESSAKASAEYNDRLRAEISGSLRDGRQEQRDQLFASSKLQTETLISMKDSIIMTLSDSMERMQTSNEARLDKIQGVVDKKLDRIQGVVDEKLDRTLNERLDANFKAVGDQLGQLYKTLGELQNLSNGVTDLSRTLSNVKTRGVWGEVQLSRILEQTMSRSQYETNVATRRNSDDRVEFAIRFPAQDGTDESVYLPIDAKFPSDIYNKIMDASESGDSKQMESATAELRQRITTEAKKIRDKYLNPPRTTNYAIMFLPTEGLYAEVLRIDGLTEKCQNMGIIVAGPTTITAILNSLQAGFRNIALSKKSVEVMKLLEAVKTQFARMDEEVERAQKKLHEAADANDQLRNRTRIIRKRMKGVAEIGLPEAERLLGMEGGEV